MWLLKGAVMKSRVLVSGDITTYRTYLGTVLGGISNVHMVLTYTRAGTGSEERDAAKKTVSSDTACRTFFLTSIGGQSFTASQLCLFLFSAHYVVTVLDCIRPLQPLLYFGSSLCAERRPGKED
jgi:hypothetical protein